MLLKNKKANQMRRIKRKAMMTKKTPKNLEQNKQNNQLKSKIKAKNQINKSRIKIKKRKIMRNKLKAHTIQIN